MAGGVASLPLVAFPWNSGFWGVCRRWKMSGEQAASGEQGRRHPYDKPPPWPKRGPWSCLLCVWPAVYMCWKCEHAYCRVHELDHSCASVSQSWGSGAPPSQQSAEPTVQRGSKRTWADMSAAEAWSQEAAKDASRPSGGDDGGGSRRRQQ